MARIDPPYEEPQVALDRLFERLQDPRRRRIITALMAETPRWKDEFETEEFRPAETGRAVAAIDLQHRHLPQLEEAGLIEWDRATGSIARGKHFDELRPVLELIDDLHDQPHDTHQ